MSTPYDRGAVRARLDGMDPIESAAQMIADDAIRMAKEQGVTDPDEVPLPEPDNRTEVTQDMIRRAIRARWDDPTDKSD